MADTWSFSYTSLSGDPIVVSGSGFFTTGTPYGNGYLPILSITGVTNSAGNITGLHGLAVDPPGANNDGTFQWDNAFKPSGDPLTNNGLLFNVDGAGMSPINIFGDGGDYEYSYGQGLSGYYVEQVTFTATNVPDGGTTLSLLGLALAGLAGLRRKMSL
jgi:hypothetical protein